MAMAAPQGGRCPLFDACKFCIHGLDCTLEHVGKGAATERSVTELLNELVLMGNQHMAGDYQCLLCGAKPRGPLATAPVGETEAYAFCEKCSNFYFYPHVQVLILKLLEEAGTDYKHFKTKVDLCYRRLPAALQPALMYEAHRWATSRFAWSLTYPENAREILEVVFKYLPKVQRVVSMGSGTGYIEHVFHNAAKELGHPLEMLAYDSMEPRKNAIKFDVQVQRGDVSVMPSLGSMKDELLLLCWPPFGSKVNEESQMAFDTIKQYEAQGGTMLVYIGDVNATGDWRYHDHLASHWEQLPETLELSKLFVWVPQQMGLIYAGNDSVGIYRKRETPLQIPERVWHVTR